ncbi:MAG: hypothetical protein AB7J94_07255, partial [Geobacter sp.]
DSLSHAACGAADGYLNHGNLDGCAKGPSASLLSSRNAQRTIRVRLASRSSCAWHLEPLAVPLAKM